MGPDPEATRRKSDAGGVGLTNLGATCYMNAVLQMMYHIRPFRDSILALQGQVVEDPLVGQTQARRGRGASLAAMVSLVGRAC